MHEAMKFPSKWLGDVPSSSMRLLQRTGVFLALTTLVACHPMRAQSVAPTSALPTELAVAILTYRASYLERATPIDACSLVRVMSAPGDFPEKFPRLLRSQFDRQVGDACSPAPQPQRDTVPEKSAISFERTVNVDSAGIVRLVVRTGENLHREDYSVRKRPGERGWVVGEVRIWGAVRMHFTSP
ncbi:MAG: hypothetical protein JWL61_2327 [Gemmatimonadetes bacterium]|nr:hypothetical protein [Gemmatimonadota bacterium]